MLALPDISTLARHWFLACVEKGEGGMTKADLVDQVAAAVQMPKHQTEAVITRFLEAIMAAVQTEQRVDLRGFGSFRLRQRQARTGRNPRTGDPVVVCPNPADNSLSANTRYNALISPPSEGALPWCRIFFSTSWR
jgi:integration host factor subunit beta